MTTLNTKADLKAKRSHPPNMGHFHQMVTKCGTRENTCRNSNILENGHPWAIPIASFTWHLTILISGLILSLCPANERRPYFVTTSLIGWCKPRIRPGYAMHEYSRKIKSITCLHINGSALAMALRLSCTNLSMCSGYLSHQVISRHDNDKFWILFSSMSHLVMTVYPSKPSKIFSPGMHDMDIYNILE